MPVQSKTEQVAADLRLRIAGGEYAPGDRLPTRSDLLGHYEVSPTTIQRAFDTLIYDGFVETRGKAGTFVSDSPPHLAHYAMVLHGDPGQSRWYRALAHQAARVEAAGRQISTYYRIDRHHNTPDYERIVRDIKAHRVAGIIFSTTPFEYEGTPLLDAPGIARCALMTGPYPGVAAIYVDYRAFFRRALEYLAARGCRRVAWLLNQKPGEGFGSLVKSEVDSSPLYTRRAWYQYASHLFPEGVSQAASLLVDGPAGYRPDGLVIVDDNLVEAATAGLAASGIGAEALTVVAYCNFPEAPPSTYPVTRLGIDVGEVMDRCLDSIDRQRRGEPVAAPTMLIPRFERELEPVSHGVTS